MDIKGSIMGIAVGDSIGLPYEGLKRKRANKFIRKELKHRFLINKGMISDDTEHSLMVAQSLVKYSNNLEGFSKALAWKLRFWFLGLPAGIGMATLKSILKLWLGFSYKSSGIFSAGNGPAMRAPIIGVFFKDDIESMRKYVKSSTIVTHTDPKAEYGAFTIAYMASLASKKIDIKPNDFLKELKVKYDDFSDEYLNLLAKVVESVNNKESLNEYLDKSGQENGVSGYIYHTLPAVLHVWLRNQNDFKNGIEEIIRAGGDTDSTAAILGGIIGARVGIDGIPKPWIKNIIEFPRSVKWSEKLSEILSEVRKSRKNRKYLFLFWPFILIRNAFFMLFVLIIGFRRMLPPY